MWLRDGKKGKGDRILFILFVLRYSLFRAGRLARPRISDISFSSRWSSRRWGISAMDWHFLSLFFFSYRYLIFRCPFQVTAEISFSSRHSLTRTGRTTSDSSVILFPDRFRT